MKLLVAVLAFVCAIYGTESHRCNAKYTNNICPTDCKRAYVKKEKELPFGCKVNVGACKPIRCASRYDRRCSRLSFCRPKMEERTFVCNEKEFVQEVVAECVCQPVKRILIKGRVIERLNDGEGSGVAGVDTAYLSVDGYYRGLRADENGFFSFEIPYCPRKIIIRASQEGYVSTLKVLDIPMDTLGLVENVQIVLFRLAPPVLLVPNEENVLQTSGTARVVIPAGTTFEDDNGNEVGGNVNAILNFIDPSNDNFDDAPGIFLTNGEEQLMSFGVLNLRFQDDVGNNLLPQGNIRIRIVDTEETGYKLWTLNNQGVWKEKRSTGVISVGPVRLGASLLRRNKRQAGGDDLGSFGTDDIGRWINIDKVPNADRCYVKTRVFEDISFASEVPNGGLDTYQPKFLLKVGNSAPYQGLNLYRPPTNTPAQTCFEVRCGDDPKVQGYVKVFTQETLGNGQSVPIPAIPVQLGNPALPATLNTDLANLNYQVNPGETEARLDFLSSTSGTLYTDKTVCEQSALTDNALWFARRKPVFTNTDFGDDFCYVRINLYQRGPNATEYLDQLQGTSVWGPGPYSYADSIVQSSEFVSIPPREFACLRYRCSEAGDLTTILLQTFVTNENVTCYTPQFTAPDLNAGPAYGYYQGLNENEVKEECLAETNPEKTAGYVSCYIRQGSDGADQPSGADRPSG